MKQHIYYQFEGVINGDVVNDKPLYLTSNAIISALEKKKGMGLNNEEITGGIIDSIDELISVHDCEHKEIKEATLQYIANNTSSDKTLTDFRVVGFPGDDGTYCYSNTFFANGELDHVLHEEYRSNTAKELLKPHDPYTKNLNQVNFNDKDDKVFNAATMILDAIHDKKGIEITDSSFTKELKNSLSIMNNRKLLTTAHIEGITQSITEEPTLSDLQLIGNTKTIQKLNDRLANKELDYHLAKPQEMMTVVCDNEFNGSIALHSLKPDKENSFKPKPFLMYRDVYGQDDLVNVLEDFGKRNPDGKVSFIFTNDMVHATNKRGEDLDITKIQQSPEFKDHVLVSPNHTHFCPKQIATALQKDTYQKLQGLTKDCHVTIDSIDSINSPYLDYREKDFYIYNKNQRIERNDLAHQEAFYDQANHITDLSLGKDSQDFIPFHQVPSRITVDRDTIVAQVNSFQHIPTDKLELGARDILFYFPNDTSYHMLDEESGQHTIAQIITRSDKTSYREIAYIGLPDDTSIDIGVERAQAYRAWSDEKETLYQYQGLPKEEMINTIGAAATIMSNPNLQGYLPIGNPGWHDETAMQVNTFPEMNCTSAELYFNDINESNSSLLYSLEKNAIVDPSREDFAIPVASWTKGFSENGFTLAANGELEHVGGYLLHHADIDDKHVRQTTNELDEKDMIANQSLTMQQLDQYERLHSRDLTRDVRSFITHDFQGEINDITFRDTDIFLVTNNVIEKLEEHKGITIDDPTFTQNLADGIDTLLYQENWSRQTVNDLTIQSIEESSHASRMDDFKLAGKDAPDLPINRDLRRGNYDYLPEYPRLNAIAEEYDVPFTVIKDFEEYYVDEFGDSEEVEQLPDDFDPREAPVGVLTHGDYEDLAALYDFPSIPEEQQSEAYKQAEAILKKMENTEEELYINLKTDQLNDAVPLQSPLSYPYSTDTYEELKPYYIANYTEDAVVAKELLTKEEMTVFRDIVHHRQEEQAKSIAPPDEKVAFKIKTQDKPSKSQDLGR